MAIAITAAKGIAESTVLIARIIIAATLMAEAMVLFAASQKHSDMVSSQALCCFLCVCVCVCVCVCLSVCLSLCRVCMRVSARECVWISDGGDGWNVEGRVVSFGHISYVVCLVIHLSVPKRFSQFSIDGWLILHKQVVAKMLI